MEVRAKNGKGPLLFKWDPETQTVDLIRKDKYYQIRLSKHSYYVKEECSKYECRKPESYEHLNP